MQSQNLSNTPEVIRRKKLMVWLWANMSARFGGVWESAYGGIRDPGIRMWMDDLGAFSDDEIRGAAELAKDWDGKFPPTCPEFRALCMSVRAKSRPNWTEQRIEREVSVAQLAAPKAGDSAIATRYKAMTRAIPAGEHEETREESLDRLKIVRTYENHRTAEEIDEMLQSHGL